MNTPKPLIYSSISTIDCSTANSKNIQIDVLREDLNHSEIQGNKYRKLYYNLLNAKKKGNATLLTFGGAYSNHLLAVAAAGKSYGFKTIGMVRGEVSSSLNYTLSKCKEYGMEIHYVDRTTYRQKHTQDFKEYLRNKFGVFYLIPEGGTNYYAINGCMEIIPDYKAYDYICCPVGTGGTIAGITIANNNQSKILGFSALKGGDFLETEVNQLINSVIGDEETAEELMKSFTLMTDFHAGGYAKVNQDLLNFVRKFYENHQIKLDLIYNGKMVFGIQKLLEQNYFPENSRILLVHTGGLQGIRGMEERLEQKIYD